MKPNTRPYRKFYAKVGFATIVIGIVASIYLLIFGMTESVAEVEVQQPEETEEFYLKPTGGAVEHEMVEPSLDYVEKEQIVDTVTAKITGYNTVEAQTDSTPCIAANGENICGRYDTVACPTYLELGSSVMIYGRIYECVDRTASKYDGRFDINCNLDFDCPRAVTGTAIVHILN